MAAGNCACQNWPLLDHWPVQWVVCKFTAIPVIIIPSLGVEHACMLLVPVCSTLIFLVCAAFSCSTWSGSLENLQLSCGMKLQITSVPILVQICMCIDMSLGIAGNWLPCFLCVSVCILVPSVACMRSLPNFCFLLVTCSICFMKTMVHSYH